MKVCLFGVLKEQAGEAELSAPDSLETALAVESWLVSQHPQLEAHKKYWRMAVNHEYASRETQVTPQSEIAFIPPVSGG